MATSNPSARSPADLSTGTWLLDPEHSSVEFQVRNFYGLMTVKGSFSSYRGTLQMDAQPAVELTIDANSLETHQAKRDTHLRSADFFDVEHHPQVRFLSDRAVIDGDTLKVQGELQAAGKQIPLQVDGQLRVIDGELEIAAVAEADQRQLDMTWSPLGMVRAPSKLIIGGRLVRSGEAGAFNPDVAAGS